MNSLPYLVREAAEPLVGSPSDYDSLVNLVGDARFVLLGEASHGTHEFYRERAQISKRLIVERGFSAVAVEADWPDAYRVNRFVRGASEDVDSVEALSGFKRFPQWMWRNADVLDFIGWLREHNDAQSSDDKKSGFYGLDLYSLYASIEAVLDYLGKVDPEGAGRARHHYSCFEHFGKETETYGWATGFGLTRSCEEEVVKELTALRVREDLPLIAITRDNDKHLEALAYANGATACFPKPVSTTQLVAAIRELCGPKLEPTFA